MAPPRCDPQPILEELGAEGVLVVAAGVWNLTTPYGDLGVSMVPSGTDGYADLRAARDVTAFGLTFQVASPADVIRSKKAASRPEQ